MVARPDCFMRSYRVHIIFVTRDVDRNDALYDLVPVSDARNFFITSCTRWFKYYRD